MNYFKVRLKMNGFDERNLTRERERERERENE